MMRHMNDKISPYPHKFMFCSFAACWVFSASFYFQFYGNGKERNFLSLCAAFVLCAVVLPSCVSRNTIVLFMYFFLSSVCYDSEKRFFYQQQRIKAFDVNNSLVKVLFFLSSFAKRGLCKSCLDDDDDAVKSLRWREERER